MKRLRVAVLFGGRSTEHEVSILSAQSIIRALDPERYEVVPLYIDRSGRWLVGESLQRLLRDGGRAAYVYLPPDPTQRALVPAQSQKTDAQVTSGPSLPPIDVVFPVFHGVNGEDGTIQGVLELANVPYVGAGVLGSALGLDKIFMKRAFAAAGLPIVDYLAISRREFEANPQPFLDRVEREFGYPCFAKFANSGSSVGTTKAHNREELQRGLQEASRFDRKLLVERGIEARELEVSVLGNDQPQSSVVGEVIPAHEFYDYEAKYLDEGSRLEIPARIASGLSDRIREIAIEAFKSVDAAGMARVDFFLERGTDRVYVNELNTIPGFTKISMYPKLWEATGLSYKDLLDRLIALAIERFEDRQRSQTAIDSRLLPEGEKG